MDRHESGAAISAVNTFRARGRFTLLSSPPLPCSRYFCGFSTRVSRFARKVGVYGSSLALARARAHARSLTPSLARSSGSSIKLFSPLASASAREEAAWKQRGEKQEGGEKKREQNASQQRARERACSFSFSRVPGVSRESRACRDALGDAAVIYRATDRIVAWLSRVLRALLRGWEGDGEKRQEEQERKREKEREREKGMVFHYPVCLIPERFRCPCVGHRFWGPPSGPPLPPPHTSSMPLV